MASLLYGLHRLTYRYESLDFITDYIILPIGELIYGEKFADKLWIW